jgi:hypothetical protein
VGKGGGRGENKRLSRKKKKRLSRKKKRRQRTAGTKTDI